MAKCPITYHEVKGGHYSPAGLRSLNSQLKDLHPLPFDRKDLLREAARRADRMSIQGAQPKLSAVLSVKNKRFELVSKEGRYILKPANDVFEHVPENEDLTMKLAATAGIEVPEHGMVWAKDKSLVYWIRRFDRIKRKDKVPVEDFAQLLELDRDTKYEASMERLVPVIDKYCTFPIPEKVKLFHRTLFCWLTGNEDMHLKNFSLISREGKIELSPAYDLVNSNLVLDTENELALPLNGKQKKLSRKHWVEYWGKERLGLADAIIAKRLRSFEQILPNWLERIDRSFLQDDYKKRYKEILMERYTRLGLNSL